MPPDPADLRHAGSLGSGLPERTLRIGLAETGLTDADYAALARFRLALRQVTALSDEAMASEGLGPRRFQALLAIKTCPGRFGLSVGDLAGQLFIKPNSAAELANRLEAAGLVRRVCDERDRRRALLQLTDGGLALLERIAHVHVVRLRESRAVFLDLFAVNE